MAAAVQFWGGKILLVDGKVAMDPACCCGSTETVPDDCCPYFYLEFPGNTYGGGWVELLTFQLAAGAYAVFGALPTGCTAASFTRTSGRYVLSYTWQGHDFVWVSNATRCPDGITSWTQITFRHVQLCSRDVCSWRHGPCDCDLAAVERGSLIGFTLWDCDYYAIEDAEYQLGRTAAYTGPWHLVDDPFGGHGRGPAEWIQSDNGIDPSTTYYDCPRDVPHWIPVVPNTGTLFIGCYAACTCPGSLPDSYTINIPAGSFVDGVNTFSWLAQNVVVGRADPSCAWIGDGGLLGGSFAYKINGGSTNMCNLLLEQNTTPPCSWYIDVDDWSLPGLLSGPHPLWTSLLGSTPAGGVYVPSNMTSTNATVS